MNDLTKISGNNTVKDWKNLREKIRANPDEKALWKQAYDFFEKRIESRYLKPINDIKEKDKLIGEGFSIMAILCSLIEFLETTWTGEVYKYKSPNKENYEYNTSKEKFISFLENRPPFNKVFKKEKELARMFYEDVRCGILHEAQTKNNWVIRANNEKNKIYESRDGNKIIYRNKFENGIREYIEFYKSELIKRDDLQEAFIRKMNKIAGLSINF
jgi:hypothetical protein